MLVSRCTCIILSMYIYLLVILALTVMIPHGNPWVHRPPPTDCTVAEKPHPTHQKHKLIFERRHELMYKESRLLALERFNKLFLS